MGATGECTRVVRNELEKLQHLRKTLLSCHKNFLNQQLVGQRPGTELPVQAVDGDQSSSNKPGAVAIIANNCQREADALERGHVVISVLGEMKVGKSTLCNAILGEPLLPVETAPCTSVNCIIASGDYISTRPTSCLDDDFDEAPENEEEEQQLEEREQGRQQERKEVEGDLEDREVFASSSSTSSPTVKVVCIDQNRDRSNNQAPQTGRLDVPPRVKRGTPTRYCGVFFNENVKVEELLESIIPRPGEHQSEEFLHAKALLLELFRRGRDPAPPHPDLEGCVRLYDVQGNYSTVSNLPIELRREAIIVKVVLISPILGLREPGIMFSDCPGLRENEQLSDTALQMSQRADIIIFMMNINRNNISRETLEFLQFQINSGASVLYVFNRYSRDKDSSVRSVVAHLQRTLNESFPRLAAVGRTAIHIVNSKKALKDVLRNRVDGASGFPAFQETLCKLLQERAKAMVFHFSHAFFQLLRSQYVIVSRCIGYGVQTHARRPVPPVRTSKPDPMVRLKTDVEQLIKDAEIALREYKARLVHSFLKLVDTSIHEYHVRVSELPTKTNFGDEDDNDESSSSSNKNTSLTEKNNAESAVVAAPKSWLSKLFTYMRGVPASKYETELLNALLTDFDRRFHRQFLNWISMHRASFALLLADRASKIQDQTADWTTNADTMTVHSRELFRGTESQIDAYGREGATAVHLGLSVATTAGAGMAVTGATFLVGLLSSTVATGGVTVLAAVGIAGILSAGLAMRSVDNKKKRSMSDVQADVVVELGTMLRGYAKSSEFDQLIDKHLTASCRQLLDYTKSSLEISMFEVAAITQIAPRIERHGNPLDFEKLCHYVYTRDHIMDVVLGLSQSLQEFDDNVTKSISSLFKQSKALSSSSPASSAASEFGHANQSCALCLEEFHRCGHLCAHCTVSLTGKCPICKKWELLSERFEDSQLRKEIQQHFLHTQQHIESSNATPSSSSSASSELRDDDFFLIPTLTASPMRTSLPSFERVSQQIRTSYAKVVTSFVEWLNNSCENKSLTTSDAADKVQMFCRQLYEHLAPEGVSDSYRRMLVTEIHERLFPDIHARLFRLYINSSAQLDATILEFCKEYYQSPFSTWYTGTETNPTSSYRIPEAVARFATFFAETLPLRKLRALVRAVREFCAHHPSLSGDEMYPLLIYVSMQANVAHQGGIYAHLDFCNDMLHKNHWPPLLTSQERYVIEVMPGIVELMLGDGLRKIAQSTAGLTQTPTT